jgi:hypothetical protein
MVEIAYLLADCFSSSGCENSEVARSIFGHWPDRGASSSAPGPGSQSPCGLAKQQGKLWRGWAQALWASADRLVEGLGPPQVGQILSSCVNRLIIRETLIAIDEKLGRGGCPDG